MVLDALLSLLSAAEPTPPSPDGSVDLSAILTLLLGAGGTGALAGLIALYRTWKKGRLEDEQTLIARLNADSKSQGDRADVAEKALVDVRREFDEVAADLRRQRDEARERVAYHRSFLIEEGYRLASEPLPAEPRSGARPGPGEELRGPR